MPLRKSPEEKAMQAEFKERQAEEKEAEKRAQRIAQEKRNFFATPAGEARLAFEAGDFVFQYEIDVMRQQAIVVAMVGSNTSKKTTDPVVVLNSVCREGWELVNGSFVFIEEGQQSRDKFMSSGQNVATKGTTMGYYLFKRCEANRQHAGNPWEAPAAATAEVAGVEVAAT